MALTFEQARDLILSRTPVLRSESLLLEHAAGRVLAEDIVCDIDMPPFDRSAMDGYAITGGVAGDYRLIGAVPAGGVFAGAVAAGQCVEIMTGAPIPAGADRVVMIEHTELTSDGQMRVIEAPKPGANIARRGEDIVTGQIVAQRGDVLSPQRLGIVAMAGYGRVAVVQKPRAGILTTGDEVIPPDQRPGPGQVRNANLPLVAGLLAAVRIPYDAAHHVADDLAGTAALLRRGTAEHDVFFVTGGVSMGRTDYVRPALAQIGAEIAFDKINMKPGKPMTFAVAPNGCLVFALPGNPVSVLVAFEEFVLGALRLMEGHSATRKREFTGCAAQQTRHKSGRTELLRARVSWSAAGWRVEVPSSSGSGDLMSTSQTNALAIVPAGQQEVAAGGPVPFHLYYSHAGEAAFA